MKYFLMIFLFMWSLPVLANTEFIGVWSWAAFQCRNSTLETESARSTTWSIEEANVDISSAKITMESNNQASFTFCCDENGNQTRETGTWTVEDESHVQMGDDQGGFSAWLIDGALVIYGDQEGVDIGKDNSTCNSNEKFVMIFGRVDR